MEPTIWFAPFATLASRAERDAPDFLNEAERTRAASYVFEADAVRFRLARTFLRRVLAMVTFGGRDPFAEEVTNAGARLALRNGPYGKPYLEDGAPWHFNASRTREAVTILVAEEVVVGIDMEPTARFADMTKQMLKNVLAGEECQAFEKTADRLSPLRAWTRKEAVAKADGRGLGLPFDEIVTFDTGDSPLRVPDSLGMVSNWKLHTTLMDGHILSAACYDPNRHSNRHFSPVVHAYRA